MKIDSVNLTEKLMEFKWHSQFLICTEILSPFKVELNYKWLGYFGERSLVMNDE